jgi:hypothetical protein
MIIERIQALVQFSEGGRQVELRLLIVVSAFVGRILQDLPI